MQELWRKNMALDNTIDVAEHLMNKQMEDNIKQVSDKDKREYMERVWNMSKDQIFHELMRVHGESAKLLMAAEDEIARLRGLNDPEKLH